MWNFADLGNSDVMAPSKRKEGCKFTGVSRNQEDKSVIFHFLDSTGAKLDHREFVPKRLSDQTDEKFKTSCSMVASRLGHIFRAFVTEAEFLSIKVDHPDDLKLAGDNFMDITKQMGGILKKKMESPGFDNTCDLKITLKESKGKWYSSFPAIPVFISTKNHPKDFKWDPNYDFLEPPMHTPDKEKTSQASASSGAGAQQSAFAGVAATQAGAAPAPTVEDDF